MDNLDGNAINDKLERGLFGKHEIKQLIIDNALAAVNPMVDADRDDQDVGDPIVIERYHCARADWDDDEKRLSITRTVAGKGYWIPYSAAPSLGTFTPDIPAGITWVATGPFSGCYAVTFSNHNDRVFAHVVTPSPPDPDDQVRDIAARLGWNDPGKGNKVSFNMGFAFAFWTKRSGTWCRRIVERSVLDHRTVVAVHKRENV